LLKGIYARHEATVEPVFGQIKHRQGFRQFLLRGVNEVRLDVSLIQSRSPPVWTLGSHTSPAAWKPSRKRTSHFNLARSAATDTIMDQLLGHARRAVLRFYTARVPEYLREALNLLEKLRSTKTEPFVGSKINVIEDRPARNQTVIN
jgi:hypothetical protein